MRILIILLLCVPAARANAQLPSPVSNGEARRESVQPAYFRGVEFVSGPVNVRTGKVGCLVVDASEVRLIDDANCKSWNKPNKHPEMMVAIQLVSVTKVANTIERNGPNASDILAFGLLSLAVRNRDEHVFITSETADRAAVVTFRVEKNLSPAIITAIEFAVKKLKDKG